MEVHCFLASWLALRERLDYPAADGNCPLCGLPPSENQRGRHSHRSRHLASVLTYPKATTTLASAGCKRWLAHNQRLSQREDRPRQDPPLPESRQES
jgi:hypothetical protein